MTALDCVANAAAVLEQGDECPLCGLAAKDHRDDESDPMEAVFDE